MAAAQPQYSRWLNEESVSALGSALDDPPSVRKMRQTALRDFQTLALEPNPVYRGYTNIAGADLSNLDAVDLHPSVGVPAADPSTVRLVHDGSGTRIELPTAVRDAGVTVETLPELWQVARDEAESPVRWVLPGDKLSSLALALVNRAVRIRVPDDCPVPVRVQDITILSRPHQALAVFRSIRAGARTRVLVSEETYSTSESSSDGQRLYASTVSVETAADAALHYVTLHAPDPLAVSLYQRHATVGPAGQVAWLWSGFGGLRTRLKNVSELQGNGSRVEDLQTFYGQGGQAYDSAVEMRHIGTDTHGQSITRGIFTDESQGISRGLVRIEKEARKTLSFLSEHAMLLSRGARSESIPVLEILCRDVKATHSSSVAPVDPEKVFYLESRGLARTEAVRMIAEGFLSHVLERAPVLGLREYLYPVLAARWARQPIVWAEDSYPALPPLVVRSETATEEWRFDAKLR
jgi:Fe-S cluster assembly scaffold protein SufB